MNIRFSFLCRSKRTNSNNHSPIVLRIIYRSERRDIYTGLTVILKKWDAKASKLLKSSKTALTVNRNLEMINHKGHQAFEELRLSGVPFTIDELVDRIKGKEQKPVALICYLKSRNAELKERAGIDITHTTYEKYERSLGYMINFLEERFKMKNYPL